MHARTHTQSKKAITAGSSSRPHLARVEKRLLAIPLLYILLRVWGTLQFIFSIAVDHTNTYGCIPETVQRAYFVFGILQVRKCMYNGTTQWQENLPPDH